MDASAQRLYRSDPENPFVMSDNSFTFYSLKLNSLLLVKLLINWDLPSKFGKGIYNRFTNLLLTASSNCCGKFVAPITNILYSGFVFAPSNSTKNSFFTLLELYCSPSLLAHKSESISSINITLGCLCLATANKVLTNF